MRKGTLSLLFGVHQFLIHPLVVWLAWRKLYGFPGWRECICIFIHDWGYWGLKNMDDILGKNHPLLGARIASFLFGEKYKNLCMYHSRYFANIWQTVPSKLCWADKLSIVYERWWTYLPRAWVSGELKEYREDCARKGFIPLSTSHREWFCIIQEGFRKMGTEQEPSILYKNEERHQHAEKSM